MKKLNFVLAGIFLCTALFSQNTQKYELIGALTTAGNQVISYKILFEQTGGGKITGVSVTDFYGENLTKSTIEGTLSGNGKVLSFTETENISTKADEEAEYFCYVKVEDLRLRTIRGKQVGNGQFLGVYPSGDTCASGIIYLVSADIIDDVRSAMDTMSAGGDTLRKIDSLLTIAQHSHADGPVLKSGKTLSMDWQRDSIVFDVWDGNKEDNDMINIYFNARLIAENLVIKNARKTISIPFFGQKGVVRVKAVNEGDAITNTVNFELHREGRNTEFSSILREGEVFMIEFNRN